MKVTTWTNWYANQPDNLLGNQDAVATDTKEEGLWWDKDTTNGDTVGKNILLQTFSNILNYFKNCTTVYTLV